MNWYNKIAEKEKYGFVFSEVNKDNVEEAFSKLLNYRLIKSIMSSNIKTAQAVKLDPRFYPSIANWWDKKNKNVNWLSNKFNVQPTAINNALNSVFGPKWKGVEKKRNVVIEAEKEKNLAKIENKVLSISNNINEGGRAVSAKNLAEQFNVSSQYILTILNRNNFQGRILGRSEKLTPQAIKAIIDIQTQAKRNGRLLSAPELIREVAKQTGQTVSHSTIQRNLAPAGMRTRNQKRDPILTDLLHRFWSAGNSGFWNKLENMDEMSQYELVNRAIDGTFANYDEKRMLKEYFLTNKIQLRDVIMKGSPTNFEIDPNHPSTFLQNRN